nr:uncharacterized protein CTRU02_01461 [Colletotrichum truncatum]KAF6799782.1 hypothetical protein CTRU02_01461 [Colletotrichum truncatum]
MHTIYPSLHTLPIPWLFSPTPLPLLPGPKGTKSPVIPNMRRDYRQVSLPAPQLGHPSPTYPISSGAIRAAVCSSRPASICVRQVQLKYYFHPLLCGIKTGLHISIFPPTNFNLCPRVFTAHGFLCNSPSRYRNWQRPRSSSPRRLLRPIHLTYSFAPISDLSDAAPFVPSQSQS